jgi:Rap1a immunity proteins
MRQSVFFDYSLFLVSFSVALGALSLIIPARGATLDDFQARTTSQYVDLCQARASDENYVAAIQFCQGFASGAYQYYVADAVRDPDSRFVCFAESNPPMRDAVLVAFVAWVKAHPETVDAPPVESFFRFLTEAYPCLVGPQAAR